jgi:hypothetical protein
MCVEVFASTDLIGRRHEILSASLIRKRQFEPVVIVDLRAVVLSVFPESPGFGGTDGPAGSGRGPHDHLALDSAIRPEIHRRLRGQMKLKSSTWHFDET